MGDISLDLIERLRAKAEATTFDAEARAFRAKADELSARHERGSHPVPGDRPAGAEAKSAREDDEHGLAQWRTPAWWLVQSSSFRDRQSDSRTAAG